MDIFDLCDCLEDDSIDMILCDLPYGITACEWDNVIPFEPMWECFKRVIKARGAVVLTASQPFTSQLVVSNLGWFKYEWVWQKTRATGFITAKLQPLRKHENILVFSLGTIANCSRRLMKYYPQLSGQPYKYKTSITRVRATVGARKSHVEAGTTMTVQGHYPDSILFFPSVQSPDHPTQKPVALFKYLIRTYTQPGAVVFDPCVGSGTTALAARNTGRNFICGDSSAEYVQVARDRLAKPYTMPMFEDKQTEDEKPEQLTMRL
jgi:site-specific DNA-methyltransferase (adenine-specific)